ncbi:hypothetical protein [Bradyrhizobium sp. STM 3557]|uniref:hypothetical protein n=1 Tax=Bradyrhizobium sp. STM 3557 TaxID=578920 RepID=UPI00388F9E50
MDMKEASAMTEASGLADSGDSFGSSSGRMPGSARTMNADSAAARVSEQLRKMTLEAPLRSLFLAFLFGFWVARRR